MQDAQGLCVSRQGVFLPELQALYSALRGGRAQELPPLEVTYADYSAWQRARLEGSQLAKSIEYWKVGLPPCLHSSRMCFSHTWCPTCNRHVHLHTRSSTATRPQG